MDLSQRVTGLGAGERQKVHAGVPLLQNWGGKVRQTKATCHVGIA